MKQAPEADATAAKRAALLRAAAMLQQKLAEVSAPPLASLDELGRSVDIVTRPPGSHRPPSSQCVSFADIPPPITAPDVVKAAEWVSAPTAVGPDSESGEEESAERGTTPADEEETSSSGRYEAAEGEASDAVEEALPVPLHRTHFIRSVQADAATQTQPVLHSVAGVQTSTPPFDWEAAEEALEQLRDKVRATQARAVRAESETQRSEQNAVSLRRELASLHAKCKDLEAAATAAEQRCTELQAEAIRWEKRHDSVLSEAEAAAVAKAAALRREKEVTRREEEFASVRAQEMSLQGEVLRGAEEALRDSEAAVAAAEERAAKAEATANAVRTAAEQAAAEVEQLWQRHGLAAEREQVMRHALQLAGKLCAAVGVQAEGDWWQDSGALNAVEAAIQQLPRRLARLHRERAQLSSAAAASAMVEAAAVKQAQESEAALAALTSERALELHKSGLAGAVFQFESDDSIGRWQLLAEKAETDASLAVHLAAAVVAACPNANDAEAELTCGDLLSTLFSAADRLVAAVGKSRHVAEVRAFQTSLRALKLRWQNATSPRSETLEHRLEQERKKVRQLQAELFALSPPSEKNEVVQRNT